MAIAAPVQAQVGVEDLEVVACTVPTDEPESDGTLEWDSTTIVIVEAFGGGQTGLGYTYGETAVAELIRSKLAGVVVGSEAMPPPGTWRAMQAAIRNAGRPGVGAMAISAVDIALWDLKAKLLGVALADALPRFHEGVPIYGSGGTSGSVTASYRTGRSAAIASSQASATWSGESTLIPCSPSISA